MSVCQLAPKCVPKKNVSLKLKAMLAVLVACLVAGQPAALKARTGVDDGESPPARQRASPRLAENQVQADVCGGESGIYFRQLLAGVDIAREQDAANPFDRQAFKFAAQMKNYVYIVGDTESGECVIVDGCWDPVRSTAEAIIGRQAGRQTGRQQAHRQARRHASTQAHSPSINRTLRLVPCADW